MKKNKKALVGILTVVTTFMTCITPAFASNYEIQASDNEEIQVLLSYEENGEQTEISVYDGTYMYYNDANNCVVSINIYPDGYIDIAKNDKSLDYVESSIIDSTSENSIEMLNCDDEETSTVIDEMSSFNESELLGFFEGIKENVLDGTIDLDERTEKNESEEEAYASRASSADIAKKIDKALTDEYGEPYSAKQIASLTSKGYTAYLYRSMSFDRYKKTSWALAIGTTLANVVSTLSLPQSTVLKILTFVKNAGTSVYKLAKSTDAYKYVANVNTYKEVKVKSLYPYRAAKTQYGTAYVGDKTAAYIYNKTSKDSDFDNNTTLMQKGIENYINR